MNYNATGGLSIGGCADTSVEYEYIAKYNTGIVAYDCRAANVGVLYKVAIKRIRVVNESGTIMYVDTFNRQWNEYDLCTHVIAQAAAIAYWENQVQIETEQLIECD